MADVLEYAGGTAIPDSVVLANSGAWHQTGTVLDTNGEVGLTIEQALPASGLDFTVVKTPIYVPVLDTKGKPKVVQSGPNKGRPVVVPEPAERRYGVVRTDTNYCLGVVGETWEPMQPIDGFQIVNDVIEQAGGQCWIETAGAIDGGRKIWVMAHIETELQIAGEAYRSYLLFTTGFDGRLSTAAAAVDERVVCHATGTPIYDHNCGYRGPVEGHPTATAAYSRPGFRITVRGLPFSETVTEEHRYWARQRCRKITPVKNCELVAAGYETHGVGGGRIIGTDADPDWVEACDLLPVAHEIGTPIDMTVVEPPPIMIGRVTNGPRRGGDTPQKGLSTGRKVLWSVEQEPRMQDPDWWWLIGYWWGDGTVVRQKNRAPRLQFLVSPSQPEALARIVSLYRSRGWRGQPKELYGGSCLRITVSDPTLANWLIAWKQGGHSQKVPPAWIEQMDLDCQAALVQGYYAADGSRDTTEGCILTSVSLEGLLRLRTILSRLGIPSSIRQARKAGPSRVQGRAVRRQTAYNIRFWRGVEQLGFTTRFKSNMSHPYIEDGWMWSRVESVEAVDQEVFWPVSTADESYFTAFGLSHNCANTLNFAVFSQAKESGYIVRVRHSKNAGERIKEAHAILGMRNKRAEELAQQGEWLVEQSWDEEKFEDFLQTLMVLPEEEGPTYTMKSQRQDQVRTIYNSPTCAPIKDTAWGSLQAVLEYDQHHKRFKDTETQLKNQLGMTHSALPQLAFELALDLSGWSAN